ncbi:hypothetical protein CDAR_181711 [Caerostris darwini]|uniref:Uncharacterized protein n=1 Tax=Caerostris darwini TaxID=1538125 RepID=A0AAV4URV1_9ARAC|nr:hypothetical protein CDAR_181711 [Caerostris darwini]
MTVRASRSKSQTSTYVCSIRTEAAPLLPPSMRDTTTNHELTFSGSTSPRWVASPIRRTQSPERGQRPALEPSSAPGSESALPSAPKVTRSH